MIISISGTPGSGKTVVSKFLAKKLKLKLYLVGEMVREIAEKKGLSIVELDKKAVSDRTIDREIDKIHLNLKNKDNFIIDSRMAFKFFPDSFKFFLLCTSEIAAKRIFRARRKGESEKSSLNYVLKEIKERNRLDILRYKRYYHVNINDLSSYDVVIETSEMNVEELGNHIINAMKLFKNRKCR